MLAHRVREDHVCQMKTTWRQQYQETSVVTFSVGRQDMDPMTLEAYRQRLLTRQQQLVQRIFEVEEDMQTLDADRNIERMDRAQEEAAEEALTALDEQGRQEVEEIQAALARLEVGCGTLTGAAVGAGSGAAIGAGTGNVGRGALIGTGVGAAVGAIYDFNHYPYYPY